MRGRPAHDSRAENCGNFRQSRNDETPTVAAVAGEILLVPLGAAIAQLLLNANSGSDPATDTLATRNNLANAYREAGREGDAEALG